MGRYLAGIVQFVSKLPLAIAVYFVATVMLILGICNAARGN